MKIEVDIPEDLREETADLIARFASELAKKLRKAEEKYDYDIGWMNDDWEDECSQALVEHMMKGDPRDVAIYCAFMWHHEWRTSLQATITP